jgi:hypothetical protein
VLKNAGAGESVVHRVLKVKLTPRRHFIELAARHFQMLQQRINLSADLTIVDEQATDEELVAGLEAIINNARARIGLPPITPLWPMFRT